MKRTTIYIDEKLHDEAKKFAWSHNLSVSQLVMIALKEAIKKGSVKIE